MEPTTETTNVLANLSNQMADAVERISNALVLVNGRRRLPGSGVVCAPNLVITADHVLRREEDLSIQTYNKQNLSAQLVGRDPSTDLAVLRVPDMQLDAATIAASPARVGQLALAVGRPTDSGPMASVGIVSAIGGPLRNRRGASLERYVQTDATPYPGFSGGPLIDVHGTLIGIVTTGLIHGTALAVPVNIAWNVAEMLSQHGLIKRGYLGISSQPVHLPANQRSTLTQESGLLVVRVEDNSPAQQGGMMVGDILVMIKEQTITDIDNLQAMLSGDAVGKTVPVTVLRGGTLQTLQITIGQRNWSAL